MLYHLEYRNVTTVVVPLSSPLRVAIILYITSTHIENLLKMSYFVFNCQAYLPELNRRMRVYYINRLITGN